MTELEEIKYETIWNPQPDITAYELAQCMLYIMSRLHDIDTWDKLDKSITRHFDVTIFNYGDMIREQAEKAKAIFAELEEDFGEE